MPLIRFNLKGPSLSSQTVVSPPALRRTFPPLAPLVTPRVRLLRAHTRILKMESRDYSQASASSGDDLKLVNRLNESRSPYVSTVAMAGRPEAARLTFSVVGSRTHEQSRCMAAMGSRGHRARKEVRSLDIRQYWLCGMSLYALGDLIYPRRLS